MGDIFIDDEGDIFMEKEDDLYSEKEKKREDDSYAEKLAEVSATYEEEEEAKKLLKPASKKERKLLTAMLDELNKEHDRWQRNATAEEIEDTHTREEISPRFELEFFKKEEIEDYGANVGLHDFGNEESEHGDAAYIAIAMMSIRYFSGHHQTSCGI